MLLLLYRGVVVGGGRHASVPPGRTPRFAFSFLGAGMCPEPERCRELRAVLGSAYQLPAGLQSLSHRETSRAHAWVWNKAGFDPRFSVPLRAGWEAGWLTQSLASWEPALGWKPCSYVSALLCLNERPPLRSVLLFLGLSQMWVLGGWQTRGTWGAWRLGWGSLCLQLACIGRSVCPLLHTPPQ